MTEPSEPPHPPPPPGPQPGLEAIPIFAELSPAERAALRREFETLVLRRGDVLMRQGDPADALYLVVSGRFAVTIAGRVQPITEIGPDQPIGEIAFLAGGTRSATVTAMRDSLVLRLGREQFDRLSAKNPGIWRALTATLARRLAVTSAGQARPEARPRTIAIIAAGRERLSREFLELLVGVFGRRSDARVIRSGDVASLLPPGAALDGEAATEALNAIEAGHSFLVMVADDEPSAWSQKAIRQADLVLAVARHGAPPEPGPLEQLAARFVPPEGRRLVLLHPTRPRRVTGTGRWLGRRQVAMHHHVALDRREDVERLYRFISGTARGFVACGGGALAAAHVGVYKALGEHGLGFDIMGGTSAGSAMTAAFALGNSAEDIDRTLDEMFVKHGAMRRYTWPRYSLLDHTHFDAELRRFFGGIDIEDLWTPYFAVSTDLSSSQLYIHRTGDLWTAVRASGSIPVLFPPLYRDGHMLVDGCLLDNVPVRIMSEIKSGPNVVVSFEIPKLELWDVDYDSLPSRSALMKSLVRGRRRQALPEAPGVTTVLMRSLMVNRQDFLHHLKPEDLLLVPPLPAGIGFLDWHRHTELMDGAFAWTKGEIERWRAEGHPIVDWTRTQA